MQPEYSNGVRITKHYHEMDPLEAAISRYEDMARRHYSLENSTLEMPKEKREAKLAESLRYLQMERMHLETINSVRTQLAIYQAKGNEVFSTQKGEAAAVLNMMNAEDHHPTAVLEKHMRAENVPKPTKYHTAHHILPGKGQYEQMAISRARLKMHLQGVRINDPVNGVYLVSKDKNTPHWSMPKSRGHLKYHTADYEKYVSMKVASLNDKAVLKTQLQLIGKILQQNEPKTAISNIARLK